MSFDTTIFAAAVGGGVASIIASGFTFWNLWLTRQSEERRQIRDLAVRAAIENWKHYNEMQRLHGGSAEPLDVYLIHAMRLIGAMDGRNLTVDEIRQRIRHAISASVAATEEIDTYNKKRNRGAA